MLVREDVPEHFTNAAFLAFNASITNFIDWHHTGREQFPSWRKEELLTAKKLILDCKTRPYDHMHGGVQKHDFYTTVGK